MWAVAKEKHWQKQKPDECGENPTKIWKNVKGIVNWISSGSPNQLFFRGQLLSKPQELAEAQNDYFLEKIQLIRDNLPPLISDPL